ncbi:hypothetical protein GBZ48_35575 [Azospirillum melinis]|uniref:DUF4376 domain-containing protein n=1 Tax=Azospirillum melinis TaxID=328839 RepID=A0ABX2KLK7_9PROT|nr:hypothetical protein [Azospirillum melinis]MBP2310702.1 hypothetical protein [Azospirillum melinis]NUB04515.1 hypothetical protein [Azospirillum melinis]
MRTPAIIVKGDGVFQPVYTPTAFYFGEGDDAVLHPAAAWSLWSAVDWTEMCPGWKVLPLIDVPPVAPGKRAEQRPMAEWIVGPDAVEVAYRLVDLSDAEHEGEIAAARTAKVRAIDAERDRRLELGALPDWPDDYAKGWIAIDNTRLPLPTPADGVALAAAVALAYSATVQHACDLKDAALTAADPATVDELAGWPD